VVRALPTKSLAGSIDMDSVWGAVVQLFHILVVFFDSLPGPAWPWWAFYIFGIWYLLFGKRRRVLYRSAGNPRWTAVEPVEMKRWAEPALDYTEHNKSKVIGWQLADPEWLRELEPADLQQRIDDLSPYGDRIADCQAQLELLEPYAKDKRASDMRKRLERTITDLRQQFVDEHVQRLGPQVQDTINRARAELPAAPPEPVQDKPRKKKR
jgi:hypothetical protein